MNRRTFLAMVPGSLLAAPLAAEAQPGKIPRIGFLDQFSGPLPNLLSAFRESMGELGYVEDRNLAIDYRFAEGRTDRLPELAAELIGLRVDVIIALGPAAVEAATARTATAPAGAERSHHQGARLPGRAARRTQAVAVVVELLVLVPGTAGCRARRTGSRHQRAPARW